MAGPVASDDGPLYGGDGDQPLDDCGCCTPGTDCYYPLTKCSDGTSAGLWFIGATDTGSGCPTWGDDWFFELDSSATCYKLAAGTAGTTTTHTLIGRHSLIDSCAHCGSFSPCSCTKAGGEVCKIKNIRLQIIGVAIVPGCCPPSSAGPWYEHMASVSNAYNGMYMLPHTASGCVFHLISSKGNWQYYRDYGTPDAEVLPEDATTGCAGNETFDVPMQIELLGSDAVPAHVGAQITGFGSFTSGVWGDSFTVGVGVVGLDTGWPFNCLAQSSAVGDVDTGCSMSPIPSTAIGVDFGVSGGTIIATAILSCPSDPPP